ncbi:MAG TPA: Crp/Fnr family transcriptional regulator [Candidatus Lachnoclostridium stercorigallinarum]|uniref:Crp/Fnr family transcriptional regulator n=1 Tax=Candidatus Lachnoclostridium stercorigallinarum TaxID=2838634 RepID=A0A9D2GIM2_9FIRM|nr:Crp/Fnr family transcriptional regulator [Candidatus Lachnoclostridium stercorigallinarum]
MKKHEFSARYEETAHREFFRHFFSRIPEELLPYLYIKKFSYGEPMILSAERSKAVYFLMRGRVHAIDDRVQSLPYVFAELFPVEILGDYELFADLDGSYATITAAEFCECIAMPSSVYLKWISGDAKALLYRLRLLIKQMGDQSAAGRRFLFMDYSARCASQVLQYAVPEGELFVMRMTREQLAAKLGCSLRTCHRVVEGLEKEGLICLRKGKIAVDGGQRERLKQYLEEKISGL